MGFGRNDQGRDVSDEMIIYMGKGVEIKGDVRFEGSGRLDGKVDGKIFVKGNLMLGEGAVISSEVEGGSIIIGGKVKGKIKAHQKVQLLKTSVVDCDITTPVLIVDEGAEFNGSARMGNMDEKETRKPIKPAIKAVG